MSIQVWHQPESGRIASKLQVVEMLWDSTFPALPACRRVGPKGLENLAQALAWVARPNGYSPVGAGDRFRKPEIATRGGFVK